MGVLRDKNFIRDYYDLIGEDCPNLKKTTAKDAEKTARDCEKYIFEMMVLHRHRPLDKKQLLMLCSMDLSKKSRTMLESIINPRKK